MRNYDSNYTLKNSYSKAVNYLFPFVNDNHWYVNGNKYVGENIFMSIKLEPHSSVIIYHNDATLSFFKICSIVLLVFLFIKIFFLRYIYKIKF
jgi:hypothetical protein